MSWGRKCFAVICKCHFKCLHCTISRSSLVTISSSFWCPFFRSSSVLFRASSSAWARSISSFILQRNLSLTADTKDTRIVSSPMVASRLGPEAQRLIHQVFIRAPSKKNCLICFFVIILCNDRLFLIHFWFHYYWTYNTECLLTHCRDSRHWSIGRRNWCCWITRHCSRIRIALKSTGRKTRKYMVLANATMWNPPLQKPLYMGVWKLSGETSGNVMITSHKPKLRPTVSRLYSNFYPTYKPAYK